MHLLDYQTLFLHEVFILLWVAVTKNLENVVSSKESAAMFVFNAKTPLDISSLPTKHSSFEYDSYECCRSVYRSDNLEKMISIKHSSLTLSVLNFSKNKVFFTVKLNFWCYDPEFPLPLLKKHFSTMQQDFDEVSMEKCTKLYFGACA